jgi:diadenosine tetraphosphatase ApaH/serine/threonine PP2A family protein phosphatase
VDARPFFNDWNPAIQFPNQSIPTMSLIALISDIHGNIDALKAVMADIDAQTVTSIHCLGDIVGYGAAPSECLTIVRSRCETTVMGNHDLMTANPGVRLASERVAAGIRYAQDNLSEQDLEWLRSLPLVVTAHDFTMVHASLANPKEFAYLTTDEEARLHFQFQETGVCFMGHTHVPQLIFPVSDDFLWSDLTDQPFRLDERIRCAINVGSVGQPRDHDPRASYGLFDTSRRHFQLRRVPYDIEKAQKRIREAGLPEENAVRLEVGV